MTRTIAAVVAAVSLSLSQSAAKPVRTASGAVSGAPGRNAAITVFKGIPFAAAPVGPLRWRAPMPPGAWQGVRAAVAFSPSCIQTIVTEKKPWTYEFMAHGEVSEDCLYLNVWTAAKSATEKRPVYVYVHGGGNTEGSGSVAVYDGESLAKKGVVVVTVNYRLGVFGFFTHPELSRESERYASGNYAILDLISSLQWVRANIAAFGGDPDKVTIGGQSAGASNSHILTASPLAKGLFRGVIAESGSTLATMTGANMRTLKQQEQDGVKFAEAKSAKSMAELRRMSWKDLAAPTPAAFRFSPVVDGWVLPAHIGEIFAQGKQNDVLTITGANKDENGAEPNPNITSAQFQVQAQQRYGELAGEFLKLYPATGDAEVP